MSSQDQTVTLTFPFWWKMWSQWVVKTSGKSPETPTVDEGHRLIPRASWFMDPRTFALRTVLGKGRRHISPVNQTLRSENKIVWYIFWGLIRGAIAKIELSVVDKIELEGSFETMTGKYILTNQYQPCEPNIEIWYEQTKVSDIFFGGINYRGSLCQDRAVSGR